MKVTEIKTHGFKTTTMKHGVYMYGYWTGAEKRKRSASFLPVTTGCHKSPPDGAVWERRGTRGNSTR